MGLLPLGAPVDWGLSFKKGSSLLLLIGIREPKKYAISSASLKKGNYSLRHQVYKGGRSCRDCLTISEYFKALFCKTWGQPLNKDKTDV